MSKSKLYILLTVLFIGSVGGFAQQNVIDSLQAVLKTAKEDTNKVNTLNKLSWELTNIGDYEKAILQANKAKDLATTLHFKKGIANAYSKIGVVNDNQGNYPEALKNYFVALRINKELENKSWLAFNYVNLGGLYTSLKNFSLAKKYLTDGLTLSKEIGSKEGTRASYGSLSTLDSIQGNWKGAYEHQKLFIIYRDSLDNEETKEKTIQEKMNYEFEKKEAVAKAEQDKKNIIIQAEKKRQKLFIWFLISIVLAVTIIALLVFKNLNTTKKQKVIIENQKEIVEKQKELVEEKQKEILDSIRYAKRIQDALLTSQGYIERNIRRLKKS